MNRRRKWAVLAGAVLALLAVGVTVAVVLSSDPGPTGTRQPTFVTSATPPAPMQGTTSAPTLSSTPGSSTSATSTIGPASGAPVGPTMPSRAAPIPEASQTLNVRQFGAKADGKADDTASIEAGVRAAIAQAKALLFPPGTYVMSHAVDIKGKVWLYGQAGAVLREAPSARGVMAQQGRHFSVLGPDVTLQGLTFAPLVIPVDLGIAEQASIYIRDAPRATVLNCVFDGSAGIFVIGPAAVDGRIVGNTLRAGPGVVYSYAGASRTYVAHNVVDGSRSNAMSGTGNADTPNTEVVIENNLITNAGRMGIEDWSHCVGTVIRNNRISKRLIRFEGVVGV